jgi:hypothetical protein
MKAQLMEKDVNVNFDWNLLDSFDPMLSDNKGWNKKPYYSTFQPAVIKNEFFFIAREKRGMITWMFNKLTDKWDLVDEFFPVLSDELDWKKPEYYSTIKFFAFDDELFLMARERRGMITWKFNFESKTWFRNPIDKFFPVYSDVLNWNKPEYYSTIQTVVVNKELFLLAREHRGMLTYMFDKKTEKWNRTPIDEFFPVFSDELKWNKPEYYSTIKTAVVNNDFFLFARERRGMLTFMFDVKNKKWFRKPVDEFFPPFSDELNWNKPEYYSTIQTTVADNKFFMFARADKGMLTYIFDMKSKVWDRVPYIKFGPELSDVQGWDKPEYYSTIKTFVKSNKIFLTAREHRGLMTWILTKNKDMFAWELVDKVDPKFSDAKGWNKPEYYSTIKPVIFDNRIFLLARDKDGLLTFMFYKPVSVS